MVKRTHGYRYKSRHILRKHPRERGMPPLGCLLRQYAVGEKVAIVINPSVHKGMPHRRFHGKVGEVVEKRGRAYVVKVRDGGKEKFLTVRPEHLKPLK